MRFLDAIKIFDWKRAINNLGNSLFSYSLVRTVNSTILVYFLVVFIKFFLIGVNQKLIVGFFEVLALFGMIIILFSVVPVVINGWGGITNILILLFGVLYFVDDSYANSFFLMIRLPILFVCLHLAWYLYKYYEGTRAEAEMINTPDYGDEIVRKPRRRRTKRIKW